MVTYMAITDALKNFVPNMLGIVEKAIIVVVDDGNGSDAGKAEEQVRLEGIGSKSNGSGIAASVLEKGVSSKDAISEMASNLADLDDLFARKGKSFKVQFNPSTLTLNAHGGGQYETKNFSEPTEGEEKKFSYSYDARPFSVTLDVDLIFNKVDVSDAFIDMLPNLGNMKGIKNFSESLVNKSADYSVQNEIEGLIATTRVFTTCVLSFNWGQMSYSGVLQSLEASYTVFNPKGEPVAGTVHLSMILIDEGVNEKSKGKWAMAYQNAFGDGAKKLSSIESSIGGSAFSNFTF